MNRRRTMSGWWLSVSFRRERRRLTTLLMFLTTVQNTMISEQATCKPLCTTSDVCRLTKMILLLQAMWGIPTPASQSNSTREWNGWIRRVINFLTWCAGSTRCFKSTWYYNEKKIHTLKDQLSVLEQRRGWQSRFLGTLRERCIQLEIRRSHGMLAEAVNEWKFVIVVACRHCRSLMPPAQLK